MHVGTYAIHKAPSFSLSLSLSLTPGIRLLQKKQPGEVYTVPSTRRDGGHLRARMSSSGGIDGERAKRAIFSSI